MPRKREIWTRREIPGPARIWTRDLIVCSCMYAPLSQSLSLSIANYIYIYISQNDLTVHVSDSKWQPVPYCLQSWMSTHAVSMSYNLELLSPPSPSHRQWRTGRVCTVRSVTGGRWESASTRCCSGRHHSTPSLSWRPMARSCNTRCSIFCVRSLLIKFCGDDWCRKVPATCVRGTFCYSTSQEAGRLMDFVIWSVVGSHSDSSDSCTLFSLDSPRHAGHMQGVLLHSLALVFTGYLQDMSAVLPAIQAHLHAPHH